MKKRLFALLLTTLMIFSLAGCAKKTTLQMNVQDIGKYQVIDFPKDLEGFSVVDNDIEITVKKDGVYSFTVKDENDKEYTFDVNYNNGAAEVYSRDGINVVVGAKK